MEIPTGKIEELERCPMGRCMANVRQWKTPEIAQREIEALYSEAVGVFERNKIKAENNKKIVDYVISIIESFGFPKSSMGYKTSRARFKTQIPKQWPMELRAAAASYVVDPKSVYDSKMADVKIWQSEVDIQRKSVEQAKQQEEKNRADLRTLIVIALKYGLTEQADADDVLEVILSKDKYLRLAYWMRRNRGDWNEGCSYARTGVRGFAIESEQDKAIIENVSSYFDEFEDGRCFRDCEWNYDRIFELADQELLKDMEVIRVMCNDEY